MTDVIKKVPDPLGIFKTDAPPVIPAPAVTRPATMPVPDDEKQRAAERRYLQNLHRRRGRESTIMSDYVSETLG